LPPTTIKDLPPTIKDLPPTTPEKIEIIKQEVLNNLSSSSSSSSSSSRSSIEPLGISFDDYTSLLHENLTGIIPAALNLKIYLKIKLELFIQDQDPDLVDRLCLIILNNLYSIPHNHLRETYQHVVAQFHINVTKDAGLSIDGLRFLNTVYPYVEEFLVLYTNDFHILYL